MPPPAPPRPCSPLPAQPPRRAARKSPSRQCHRDSGSSLGRVTTSTPPLHPPVPPMYSTGYRQRPDDSKAHANSDTTRSVDGRPHTLCTREESAVDDKHVDGFAASSERAEEGCAPSPRSDALPPIAWRSRSRCTRTPTARRGTAINTLPSSSDVGDVGEPSPRNERVAEERKSPFPCTVTSKSSHLVYDCEMSNLDLI